MPRQPRRCRTLPQQNLARRQPSRRCHLRLADLALPSERGDAVSDLQRGALRLNEPSQLLVLQLGLEVPIPIGFRHTDPPGLLFGSPRQALSPLPPPQALFRQPDAPRVHAPGALCHGVQQHEAAAACGGIQDPVVIPPVVRAQLSEFPANVTAERKRERGPSGSLPVVATKRVALPRGSRAPRPARGAP